jgi:hypothetical protein
MRPAFPVTSAIACSAIAATVVLAAAGEAGAGGSYFTSSANSSRSSHGLSSYAVASDLTSIAQRHASAMAARRSIYHNSSMGSEVCCWRAIGENVGSGPSDSSVQSAFMNSSSHRANILSSTFNEIGVGTAKGSDGLIYVDEVFRARTGSSGSTHHSSSSSSHRSSSSSSSARTTTPRSTPRVTAAPPRRLSVAALLQRKLRVLAAARGKPHDPVAAAFSFNFVMARLTTR